MRKTLFTRFVTFSYFALFFVGFLVSTPTQACACGMLVAQSSKTVAMKGERGVVVYDSKTKTEQMAIDFQLTGTSNQSALVVPTPVKSDIGQINKFVFDDLEYLFDPNKKLLMDSSNVTAIPNGAVEVLERKTVGSFEIAVLKANAYKDLYDWTRANGFLLEAEAEGPVRNYIDNKFVLNVIKLKKNAAESDINPLKFTFKADKYFYPLMEVHDARDSQKDKSLTLYLLTDKQTTIDAATINNKVVSKTKLVEGITPADDSKFSDLEFTSNSYYLNYIKTSNYSDEANLISDLGNPVSRTYAPLGLSYTNNEPQTRLYAALIAFLIVIVSILLSLAWKKSRTVIVGESENISS